MFWYLGESLSLSSRPFMFALFTICTRIGVSSPSRASSPCRHRQDMTSNKHPLLEQCTARISFQSASASSGFAWFLFAECWAPGANDRILKISILNIPSLGIHSLQHCWHEILRVRTAIQFAYSDSTVGSSHRWIIMDHHACLLRYLCKGSGRHLHSALIRCIDLQVVTKSAVQTQDTKARRVVVTCRKTQNTDQCGVLLWQKITKQVQVRQGALDTVQSSGADAQAACTYNMPRTATIIASTLFFCQSSEKGKSKNKLVFKYLGHYCFEFLIYRPTKPMLFCFRIKFNF